MHKTEGANNTSNAFTNGPPGTTLEKNWLNAVQDEIAYMITQAGLTLKTAATENGQQLKEATDALYAPRKENSHHQEYAGYGGGVETSIPYFTNIITANTGALYTITNNNTLGWVCEFLVACEASFSLSLALNNSVDVAISVNSSAQNVAPTANPTEMWAFGTTHAVNQQLNLSLTSVFAVGDKVRPFTTGVAGAVAARWHMLVSATEIL